MCIYGSAITGKTHTHTHAHTHLRDKNKKNKDSEYLCGRVYLNPHLYLLEQYSYV